MGFLLPNYPFTFLLFHAAILHQTKTSVGRSQGREVWMLPVLLEHTCTCCLWVCWQKGKVMKNRCYQFYKRYSILISNSWSWPKLVITCIAMLSPARLFLKMSFFANQWGQPDLPLTSGSFLTVLVTIWSAMFYSHHRFLFLPLQFWGLFVCAVVVFVFS